MRVDYEEFIKVWKASATPAEAGKTLDMSETSARNYAWMLRSMGFDVPLKKRGRKKK